MAKDESRRDRWVKASQRLRNALQMAAVSCYMMVLFAQPAAAADTMWTRFSTIIADVYGELVGISTIVAVTAAAVALLVRMRLLHPSEYGEPTGPGKAKHSLP